ncbi:hypothetical protein NDU88_005772 [Pleurodeles waltl]|uniref:SURP motif domain-containing protein n=2 Tax=Pleurodeles waltl TaxID=8319 RepID=A0AAV7L3M7_PLEWA|nr:hypothetical protein NDU88_005772 [Pleurodeles waltl]
MVGTVRMNRGAGASGPMRAAPRPRPQVYGDNFQDVPIRSPLESRRGGFTGPSRRDFESERSIGPFLERRRSRSPLRDEDPYFSRRAAVNDDFGQQRSREQEFRIAAQRNPSPLRSPEQLFGRSVPPRVDPERFPMRGDGGPFSPRGNGARFHPRGDGGPFVRGDGERFPPRADVGTFPQRGEGERLHLWGEGGRLPLRSEGGLFPPRGDGGPFPPRGGGVSGAFFPPGDGGPVSARGRGGKFGQRSEGAFPVRGRGAAARGGSARGSTRGRGASSSNALSVTKPGTTMDKKSKAALECSTKIATWAGFHRINANDYRRKNPAQSALDTETAVNTLAMFKQPFPPELRSRCFYLIKLFNHAALKKTNLDKDLVTLLIENNVITSPKDIRDYINPFDQHLMSLQHYLLKSAHPLFLACNTFEVNVNTGYYTPVNIFSALKKTIFYCRQALLLFGQTYSLATYLRQSRILKVLGIGEDAPKPADFPNMEDSYLFGTKYIAQLKTWLKKSGHQLKLNKNIDVPKEKEEQVMEAKLKDSEVQGLKPADPKVLETVDKLLQNAIDTWKERDSTDAEKPEKEKPDFWFLFDENCQEYKYYRLKLAELQKLKQATTERTVQTDDKTPEELAAESKSLLYARKAKEVKKKIMKGVVSSKHKKTGKTLTGALSAKKKQTGDQATDKSENAVGNSEDSSDGESSGVDSKTRETVHNLARLVTEMGPDSKDFSTDSITSNPDFWFLKEEDSEAYKYYQKKLAEFKEAKSTSGSATVKEEPSDAPASEPGDGNSEESKPALQEPDASDEEEDEDQDQAECEAESNASESAPSTPTHSRKRGRPTKASPLKSPKKGRVGELSKVEEPVTVANEKPSGRPALRKKQAKQNEEEEDDEGVKLGTGSGDEEPVVTSQQSKQDAADVLTKETGKRTRKKKAD